MLLLTPGPLTTGPETRAAMDVDHGSRDPTFVALTRRVRDRLTALATPAAGWTTVPLQGSGTFAVEAMIGTFVPRDGGVAVLVNGAYGQRMVQIARVAGRHVVAVVADEAQAPDLAALDQVLEGDPRLTHVAVVWSETTTGQVNPLEAAAAVARRHGRRLLVDGMSAFGALPADVDALGVEALAASANKCLEGVPGVAFVIARAESLAGAAGRAHALSLDLHDQWRRFEADGQWRFTPPTHVLAALDRALDLHAAEGGVAGRGARYRANLAVLVEGLARLGLRPLLPPERQGPIIVTFPAPAHPAWDFERFYEALRGRGFAIYPGKLTAAPTFRVGCIGQVYPDDLRRFVDAVGTTLAELGLTPGDAG